MELIQQTQQMQQMQQMQHLEGQVELLKQLVQMKHLLQLNLIQQKQESEAVIHNLLFVINNMKYRHESESIRLGVLNKELTTLKELKKDQRKTLGTENIIKKTKALSRSAESGSAESGSESAGSE